MATLVATAATNVGSTAAQLNGTANPDGVDTNVWFEYGLTTSYGLSTAHVYVGDGVAPVAVQAVVGGLASGHEYHFRVAAETVTPPPPAAGDLGLVPNAGFPGSYGAAAAALHPQWIREDNLSTALVNWAAVNNCGVLGLGGPLTMGTVNTYPSITHWEYDNEPYFRGVNLASWATTARNFGATFKAAYPGKTLILPMLVQANNGDYQTGGVWSPWANQVFAAAPNIGDYYDGWSAHPYSSPRNAAPNFTVTELVKSQLDALGFTKPCYITEVGWSVGGGGTQVSEATQASYIGSFIDGARTRDWIEQIYIYSLRSWGSGFEESFGMLNLNGSERTSAGVFRSKV